MSKDRARRRAEREHEAALKRAARAAEEERRERQQARRRALKAATTGRLPRRTRVGRPGGVAAARARQRTRLLVAVLILANVVVWVVRPDWPARLGALVVCALAFPVLRLLLVSRR